MKKLILVAALLVGACDKLQGRGPSENVVDHSRPAPVTLGTGQRLQEPGTLVIVGPATVDYDGEELRAPLYVADAPPMIAKDRPAITCLAFDEQGRLAGSRGAGLPMKYAGGDMVIHTTRNIGKGSVQCRLVKVDQTEHGYSPEQ